MRQRFSNGHKHRGVLVYRKSRTVWRQRTFSSPLGDTSYFLCPKCGILLEREFVRYCDGCGQKLNWSLVEAQFRLAEDAL